MHDYATDFLVCLFCITLLLIMYTTYPTPKHLTLSACEVSQIDAWAVCLPLCVSCNGWLRIRTIYSNKARFVQTMVVTNAPGVLNESCDFTEAQAWAARGIETRLTTPLKSSSKKKAKSNPGMGRFHGPISRNFPSNSSIAVQCNSICCGSRLTSGWSGRLMKVVDEVKVVKEKQLRC